MLCLIHRDARDSEEADEDKPLPTDEDNFADTKSRACRDARRERRADGGTQDSRIQFENP